MRRTRAIALASALTAMAWACGDAPAPPPEEAPPAQMGVSGRAPAAIQGLPSVISLRPTSGGSAAPPADVAVLDQLGLAFTPAQLLVRLGQPAEVVNSESLAHNVHVTFADTDSTVLLADMNSGDRMELDLHQEGGYDVVCDVHPGMRAFIYVTSAPYAAFAAADGSFLIPDVPPGSYTVSVWSADVGARSERSVQVSGTGTELDLSASR